MRPHIGGGVGVNTAVPPSHKNQSSKSHVRQFSQNTVGHGYLLAVMGSTWLSQGQCGCSGVYVPLIFMKTNLHGSYGTALCVPTA